MYSSSDQGLLVSSYVLLDATPGVHVCATLHTPAYIKLKEKLVLLLIVSY